MERKLTAILCADVLGYSRLMGENEEVTLRTLSAHRKLIDSLIEQHHGRFVNSAGDSVLAELSSVVNAVECAVEIQSTLKAENASLSPERMVLTGYAATGGGFNNYLGALRSRGMIQGDGERLTITETGIQTLGSWEPLPAGSALIDYWRSRLGKAERLILETLTQAYPDALTKEEVAAKAGYEANGGGFNNALGRLRTLELVQGRGELRASDNLFESRAG